MILDLEIDEESDGRVVIEVPSRPGVMAYGKDPAEAFGVLMGILESGWSEEMPAIGPPVEVPDWIDVSLHRPHAESRTMAEMGLADWEARLGPAPAWDPAAEVPIHWDPNAGWVEG